MQTIIRVKRKQISRLQILKSDKPRKRVSSATQWLKDCFVHFYFHIAEANTFVSGSPHDLRFSKLLWEFFNER